MVFLRVDGQAVKWHNNIQSTVMLFYCFTVYFWQYDFQETCSAYRRILEMVILNIEVCILKCAFLHTEACLVIGLFIGEE